MRTARTRPVFHPLDSSALLLLLPTAPAPTPSMKGVCLHPASTSGFSSHKNLPSIFFFPPAKIQVHVLNAVAQGSPQLADLRNRCHQGLAFQLREHFERYLGREAFKVRRRCFFFLFCIVPPLSSIISVLYIMLAYPSYSCN